MSGPGTHMPMSSSTVEEPVTGAYQEAPHVGSETKDMDEYSIFDASLQPERIIQICTLGLTMHLAYDKYYHLDFENMEILQMGAIASASIIMGVYSSLKANRGDASFLPDFNVLYLIFLPVMLSLLFDHQNAVSNIALTTNCLQISPFYGIPMQMIFIGLHTVEDSPGKKWGSLMAVPVNYVIYRILAKVSHLKSLDKTDCNLFSILLTNVLYLNTSESLYFQVLQKTLTALFIVVTINSAISFITADMLNNFLRSIILFGIISIGFPVSIKKLLIIDGEDPLVWLVHYICSSKLRQCILLTWLGSLIFLIPNILIFKSNLTLNTSRKVWHFLILLLISYPFRLDPVFVKISLSGTIVLFLCVEYLRFLKLQPFGEFLDSRLRLFSDFRDDKGPLIISYIYLIIGISAPLLICDSPVGLISLGVGDSLASIVGSKWGKRAWPGTGKTIEGTVAFIMSTYIVCTFFKEYLGYFRGISFSNLLIVCTLSGLLEGNSILNDNILIPTYMLVVERILS